MVLNWIEHNEDDYEDEKKYGREKTKLTIKKIKLFSGNYLHPQRHLQFIFIFF